MSEELKPNAFIGRAAAPADDELSAALGKTRELWDEILGGVRERFGLNEWEWNGYLSQKYGWHVRVKKGKRNIVYLSPLAGGFRVSFILGKKSVEAALASGKTQVLKLVGSGVKYPEGLGIRWDVRSSRDLGAVWVMVGAKLV